MNRVTYFIHEHPYLTGFLTLGIIFLLFALRSKSAPVQSVGVPQADPNAVLAAGVQQSQITAASQAQQNLVSAALQSKQIDATTALSAINTQAQAKTDQTLIAADVTKFQTATAADVAKNTNFYQLAIANTNAAMSETQAQDALDAVRAQVGGQVSIAQIGAGRDVSIAGIQADVAKTAIAEDLAKQGIISNASVLINGQNTDTQKYIAGVSAQVSEQDIAARLAAALHLDDTNLAITNSNNATIQNVTQINAGRDVDIAKITTDAATAQKQIDSTTQLGLGADLESIYNNLISTQGNIASQQISANQSMYDLLINKFSQVDFNRGGQGGANQVAVWSALFGQPQIGAAAEQAGGGGFNWGNFFAGLGSLFGGAAKVVTAVP